jgi:hypothetical protein
MESMADPMKVFSKCGHGSAQTVQLRDGSIPPLKLAPHGFDLKLQESYFLRQIVVHLSGESSLLRLLRYQYLSCKCAIGQAIGDLASHQLPWPKVMSSHCH